MREIDQCLLKSIAFNQVAEVIELLKRGANPNATVGDEISMSSYFREPGDRTLHLACRRRKKEGPSEIIKALIEANVQLGTTNHAGEGAAHIAALKEDSDLLLQLSKIGTPLNLMDGSSWTPLMISAERGDLASVEVLIGARVLINAANRWGSTALHLAVMGQHPKVVQCLLQSGADRWAQAMGKTPYDLAKEKCGKSPEIAILFETLDEMEALKQVLENTEIDSGKQRGRL